MKNKKWNWVFLILLISDIIYTFFQNYHTMVLDGDICPIIFPADWYSKVLTDPFGFNVLFHNEYYAATNRFFIHWFMGLYFKSVPFLFQAITDPVDSIYLSLAFGRTLIQVLIIYLIAVLASNTGKIFNRKFLIAALLVTPFFQIGGYWSQMTITLNSITYSFFYALPFVFLLLYFLPFIKILYFESRVKFNWLIHLLLIFDALIISFGGPLGAPIILILCPLILLSLFLKNIKVHKELAFLKKTLNAIKEIPNLIFYHFLIIIILCLYSSYVGTHNAENFGNQISLIDRYQLLPYGFWKLFSFKLGPPLLFGGCLFNAILIYRSKDKKASLTFNLVCLAVFACIIYLLLLPLGGYRGYRPLIVRSDTFSPITVGLIFIYSLTSIYLLNLFKEKAKTIYAALLILIAAIYTNADRFKAVTNLCEIENLKQIAASPDSIVHIKGDCNVMSWGRFTNYKNSELNGKLLQYWNITKDQKYYVNLVVSP